MGAETERKVERSSERDDRVPKSATPGAAPVPDLSRFGNRALLGAMNLGIVRGELPQVTLEDDPGPVATFDPGKIDVAIDKSPTGELTVTLGGDVIARGSVDPATSVGWSKSSTGDVWILIDELDRGLVKWVDDDRDFARRAPGLRRHLRFRTKADVPIIKPPVVPPTAPARKPAVSAGKGPTKAAPAATPAPPTFELPADARRPFDARAADARGWLAATPAFEWLRDLSDDQLAAIPIADRLALLRSLLAREEVTAGEQRQIARLLATTPRSDSAPLMDALGWNAFELLRRLIQVMTGEQFTAMREAFRRLDENVRPSSPIVPSTSLPMILPPGPHALRMVQLAPPSLGVAPPRNWLGMIPGDTMLNDVDIPWEIDARARGKAAEWPLMQRFYPGAIHMAGNFPAIDLIYGGQATPISGFSTFSGKKNTPYSGYMVLGGTGVNIKTLQVSGYEQQSAISMFEHLRPYVDRIVQIDNFVPYQARTAEGVFRIEVEELSPRREIFLYTDKRPSRTQIEGIEMFRDYGRTAYAGKGWANPVDVILKYPIAAAPHPPSALGNVSVAPPYGHPPGSLGSPLAGPHARMQHAEGATMAAIELGDRFLNTIGSYIQERDARAALASNFFAIDTWRREHPGQGVEAWLTYWKANAHPDSLVRPTRQFAGIDLVTGKAPAPRPPAQLFPGGYSLEFERRWFPPLSAAEQAKLATPQRPIPVENAAQLLLATGLGGSGFSEITIWEMLKKDGPKGELELPNKVRVTLPVMSVAAITADYEKLAAAKAVVVAERARAQFDHIAGQFKPLADEGILRQLWHQRPFDLSPRDADYTEAAFHLHRIAAALANRDWSGVKMHDKLMRARLSAVWRKLREYQELPAD